MVVNIGTETYVDTLRDGSTILRRARKSHTCRNSGCFLKIESGQEYIEFLGESAPYESGKRYHLRCAAQVGLLRKFEKGNGQKAGGE